MHLADACQPAFARHETFHPRYFWFRKAYSYVESDPHIFAREDAPLQLGVGKNMVKAIRFWGLAAKLIESDNSGSRKRTSKYVPTSLGRKIFGKDGLDPFMDHPGTLWLLHWLLLAPCSSLPIWWIAFNEFSVVEFQEEELIRSVTMRLDQVSDWRMPHPSSVKKDVNVLLRTYAPAESLRRTGIDDLLDCPLRELNLIGKSSGSKKYRFCLGAKPDLPPEILTFTALDFVSRSKRQSNTTTLGTLANEPGAPGLVFKLTEREILETLEPFVKDLESLSLTSSTGAVQLSWSKDLSLIANELLESYYHTSTTVKVSSLTPKHQTQSSLSLSVNRA